MRSRLAAVLLVALLALGANPARADDARLRIAVEVGPTSNDPHFHSLITNIAFSRHVFEPLVAQDAHQVLHSALALSWRAVEPTLWEFKLRPGVEWHDGQQFTADDVAFTIGRAGKVPNSPSSFAVYTAPIVETQVVDPLTIRFRTAQPTPLLPNYLSLIMIVSRHAGAEAATQDYNSGKAMVGTGPYKYVSWLPNEALSLVRNDSYWGDKPAFAAVDFKRIANGAAREAALLAGDADLIDAVPTADIARLKADDRVAVANEVSNRLIFLELDSDRAATPFATGRDGTPIANPLRDSRVRRALSLAINRDALVQRIMEGSALAAGDLAPPGYFGTSPDLKPDPFQPDEAKRLLADAGLGGGFALTLHGPAGRYINDERVMQSIAQMWSRVGIEAKVEGVPPAAYFSRASNLEFSAMLLGFSPNPEVLGMLEVLLHSYDRASGLGSGNRARFHDAEVDRLIEAARTTMDDAARADLTRRATHAALAGTALIPLYFQRNVWAMRKGLSYEPRTDEMTLAMSARPTH